MTDPKLAALVEAASLKRNALIRSTFGFVGEWVAVPKEDFDALQSALAALTAERAVEQREPNGYVCFYETCPRFLHFYLSPQSGCRHKVAMFDRPPAVAEPVECGHPMKSLRWIDTNVRWCQCGAVCNMAVVKPIWHLPTRPATKVELEEEPVAWAAKGGHLPFQLDSFGRVLTFTREEAEDDTILDDESLRYEFIPLFRRKKEATDAKP